MGLRMDGDMSSSSRKQPGDWLVIRAEYDI
jgi:hypothetical protein